MKKIFILLIINLFILTINGFAQDYNFDSLINNKQSLDDMKTHEEIFSLQTEVTNQKIQRNIFIISFIFMILVVIMILYIYNTKIKEVLKLVKIQERELEFRKFEVLKLGQILNHTENSILISDLRGNILWANNGFSSLFGKTYEEFKEQNSANIFDEVNEKNQKVIEECKQKKEPVFYSSEYTDEFDNKVWFQRSLVPILDESRNIINFAAIDADLTAIKLAMEQVNIQKKQVEDQKQKITDSINYASYIQRAVLPPEEFINAILPQHFILYKPRDIVSGDFYWAKKIENSVFIVAADCTGHGVPGAFMSMLGISFLNEIVRTDTIKASEILNKLKHKIIDSLHQTGKDGEQKDGMDISVCIVDSVQQKFQYSGANNDAYFIRKNGENYELKTLKANKMPIGIYYNDSQEVFENHEIDLLQDDTFYILSDGYADQFGGSAGRKFLIRNLKNLLLAIQMESMQEQKNILTHRIQQWMSHKDNHGKKYEQIDDILIIGMRIS